MNRLLSITKCCSVVSLISVIQIADLISSRSFYTIQVSEMKAEYFPPKEDVILQNEAPTDLYILVAGAVVRSSSRSPTLLFFLGKERKAKEKNALEKN